MRIIAALLSLLAIAAVALANEAFAQTSNCAPLESVIDAVGNQDLAWTGLAPTPTTPVRVMLFQSQSGAWTLVTAHGIMACVIGFGREGEAIPIGLPT